MKDIELVKLKIANAHLISDQLKELALSSVAESIFESVIENENGKEIQFERPISDVVFAAHCSIDGLIEQLEAVQRERHEAIRQKNESGERFYKAVQYGAKLEAELKRRDGQSPVAWLSMYHGEIFDSTVGTTLSAVQAYEKKYGWEPSLTETIALYPDARASVPEKVVTLPAKVNGESVEYGGSGAFTMGKRCGINEGIVRCAAALDAASVKWVEGE